MHVANIGLDRITKGREDSAKLSIVMEIYMVMYCIAINSCTIRVRVQCTLFHWLFTRGAGNIDQYFAAAWPGKIFANYSLRGRKLLENVQKVSKIAKNVTF